MAPPLDQPDSSCPPTRGYCRVIDSHRHGRNPVCRCHDQAYGRRGGGTEADRRAADRAFLAALRANRDPLAWPAWLAVRCCGWVFFNYHGFPWRGQLVRRLFARS